MIICTVRIWCPVDLANNRRAVLQINENFVANDCTALILISDSEGDARTITTTSRFTHRLSWRPMKLFITSVRALERPLLVRHKSAVAVVATGNTSRNLAPIRTKVSRWKMWPRPENVIETWHRRENDGWHHFSSVTKTKIKECDGCDMVDTCWDKVWYFVNPLRMPWAHYCCHSQHISVHCIAGCVQASAILFHFNSIEDGSSYFEWAMCQSIGSNSTQTRYRENKNTHVKYPIDQALSRISVLALPQ